MNENFEYAKNEFQKVAEAIVITNRDKKNMTPEELSAKIAEIRRNLLEIENILNGLG